jgi:hypothetical protein
MKRTLFGVCIVALLSARSVRADDPQCRPVEGDGTWSLIPAPNDPFGRILGPNSGDLKAAITATIFTIVPDSNGALHTTSQEVWMLGANNLLVFDGRAVFTQIPGEPIGTVNDHNTLTVEFGTGQFHGVTGTIHVTGVGKNIFGPGSGPGRGYFKVHYNGSLCSDPAAANSDDLADGVE